MKYLAAILFVAIATVSTASDLRSLSPKKVTQSFPHLGFEVTASVAEGDTLNLSFILDGKEIAVPEEALEGISSPQIETLALASFSSTGRDLEPNHLKGSGFVVTLQFGNAKSHGESGVTEVDVHARVTLYFDSEGFKGRALTIPNGGYSNSWKTIINFDNSPEVVSTTRSIEYPDQRFPNRWQSEEGVRKARKENAERIGKALFPRETAPAKQGSARQPATVPDSKSEGDEKPKPESAGRSE